MKSSRKKIYSHKIFFLLIAISLLLGVGTFIWSYKTEQIEVALRNRKEKELEMKKLPKEIKKEVEQLQPLSTTIRVPILVYHYVEIVTDKRDTIRKSLSIPPSILQKQIETLKDAKYTFITTADIGEALDGKKKLPEKVVVLTFDDGYRDFYTDIFPILKSENVPAVAYIVPGFLDKINYMYTWQLDEVFKSKLVEIGAHTMHHPYLKGIAQAVAQKEIIESKKTLEEHFHIPIVSFAYPYGAFDEQAVEIVKQAGFTTAVSTIGGNDVNQADRYFLYRIHPGYSSGQGLINTIERTFSTKY